MDIGLILAATAAEPTLWNSISLKVLAWVGVAAGLTFVIFVHELGHFLVAKACGVKCEKFYVGFDFFELRIPFTNWKIPRSLFKVQWGETEYGIGSLPLGGYVKMLGQDDDPRNAEQEAARIRAAAPAVPEGQVEEIAHGELTHGTVAGQPVEKLSNEALAHTQPGAGNSAEAAVPAQTTDGHTILLDPRSYPAKPVPARMAIISAGVIMNLIFAVILAAIAYRLGVEEMPAVIGSTSPGAAAWLAGIEPGSKIIQIGRQGQPFERLRWGDIRATAILNSGQEVPLLVRRPDGQEVWYEVRPTRNPETKMPMVGIGMPYQNAIEIFPENLAHLNPNSSVPLLDFDRVIEAGGQKVTSGADLTAIFAQQPLGPLNIKVERRERGRDGKPVSSSTRPAEILEVTLEPRPMRELGVVMKAGPIKAVRANSPAATAGLQVDDVIVEINGQPLGDPLSLSQRLTPQAGSAEEATIVVERKDRQGQPTRRTFTVPLELPRQSPSQLPSNPIAIESIGVALEVTNTVAEVTADGPAAKAGLEPGDIVTSFQFVVDDPQRSKKMAAANPKILAPIEFGSGRPSWPDVALHSLQQVYPETQVKLSWTRGEKRMSETLTPQDSMAFFRDNRGVALYLDHSPHIAASWKEALWLGYREAKDQLTQVLAILQRLVTGRISLTNLSGPPGIIMAAASFAEQGFASLLLFLTMLSANLAVINFLPIPALDGGHMLFLSAEAVRGKPVDERLQVRLTVVGVICLLSLMVFATMMDVQRFFS